MNLVRTLLGSSGRFRGKPVQARSDSVPVDFRPGRYGGSFGETKRKKTVVCNLKNPIDEPAKI